MGLSDHVGVNQLDMSEDEVLAAPLFRLVVGQTPSSDGIGCAKTAGQAHELKFPAVCSNMFINCYIIGGFLYQSGVKASVIARAKAVKAAIECGGSIISTEHEQNSKFVNQLDQKVRQYTT